MGGVNTHEYTAYYAERLPGAIAATAVTAVAMVAFYLRNNGYQDMTGAQQSHHCNEAATIIPYALLSLSELPNDDCH